MSLLEEYRACVEDIRRYSKDYNVKDSDLGAKRAAIQDVAHRISALREEMERALPQELDKQLQARIDAAAHQLVARREGIARAVAQITPEVADRVRDIREMDLSGTFTPQYRHLKRARKVAGAVDDAIAETFDARVMDAVREKTGDASPGEVESLDGLCDAVDKALPKLLRKSGNATVEKLLKVFLLDTHSIAKLKPVLKLLLYVAYLSVWVVLLIQVPLLLLIPYTTALLYHTASQSVSIHGLLKVYVPYRALVLGCEDADRQIAAQEKQLRDQMARDTVKEGKQSRERLCAQLAELDRQIARVAARVRAEAPREELVSDKRQQYSLRLSALQQEQRELTGQVEHTGVFKQEVSSKLSGLLKRREQLKAKITDTYLKLKKPGDSMVLGRSFCLGFSERGELLELVHDRRSTLIIYRGESPAANGNIIMMMILQLLSEMSITALEIGVVDLFEGCSKYSVLLPGDMPEYIHLLATAGDTRTYIEELHKEMLRRNKLIMTVEKDILAYNKKMLTRNSLTVPYHILIFQDTPKELMSEEKLLQILLTGSSVGIIPLVFVNHETLVAHQRESGGNRKEGELVANFLDKITGNFYLHTAMNEQIIQLDDIYKARIKRSVMKTT